MVVCCLCIDLTWKKKSVGGGCYTIDSGNRAKGRGFAGESAVGFGRFWGRRLRGRACALPLVGLDGCEVRLCDPCVRESRVPCVSRLPTPGVFESERVR